MTMALTLFQLRKKMELEQQHSITGKAIATLAGISAATYCRYENGKSVPDVLTAANLAKALNIDLPALVDIIRETVEHDAVFPPPVAPGEHDGPTDYHSA
jgi:transcriptional regulator with XRE-family HTH domain